jgi:Bacteriocin-protection, YdeI or OmpD-Associated/Domain of unknown function (DUF1905)
VNRNKYSPSQRHQFVAIIYKVGILRCVSVPEEVCALLRSGRTRTVPVVATVAGQTRRTTLVAAAGGSYRLYLDGAMRNAARADAGDPIGVSLRLDRASREMPVPEDFATALARVPDAQRYFAAGTTALRREVLRYIEQAKAAATRARRIRNCVRVLAERARKRKRTRR